MNKQQPQGNLAIGPRFPQLAVLFPVQPHSAFVEVVLCPSVFADPERLVALKHTIAGVPVVTSPPYIPSNDKNPDDDSELYGKYESILTFAGRLSQTLTVNNFAVVFAVSTERFSAFVDGPNPVGMTHFRERSSSDGKHSFFKTEVDIFFHIKSGTSENVEKMIEHIRTVLQGFADKFYVRKAFNGPDGRNQFGYSDGGSNPEVTANPNLIDGPYVDAYPQGNGQPTLEKVDPQIRERCTEEKILESFEKKNQAALKAWNSPNGQLVDLGSHSTTFVDHGEHIGGSFLLWQEWRHEGLDKFNKMSVDDQNAVVGQDIVRTHIRMTNLSDETADFDPLVQNSPNASNAPLQINRQASNFEDGTEKGLAFVAYAKSTARFDQVLDRMIGSSVTWPNPDDASTDALLDYSTAKRGAYFYVPSTNEIKAMVEDSVKKYDIAIVGGGVSGVFSAMRLKEHSPNLKVALFETQDAVGGRLVSIKVPRTDVVAEFGGMRVPTNFRLTNKMVEKLKLPTVKFFTDEIDNPTFVRGKPGTNGRLASPSFARELYHMPNVRDDELERGLFVALLTRLLWEDPIPTTSQERKNLRGHLKTLYIGRDGTPNQGKEGIPLDTMSIHMLWLNIYGQEAFDYYTTLTGYYSPWGDWNAIDAIVDNLSDLAPDISYNRLKNGYQCLVKTMGELFTDKGGSIFLNHSLKAFSTTESGFQLEFESPGVVATTAFTDKLILAMPASGLQKIESAMLAQPSVQKMIKSTVTLPFFKVFLCYKTPWWNSNGDDRKGRSVVDLPIQQLYYWDIDQTGCGVVMIYTDGIHAKAFSSLTTQAPTVSHTWQGNDAPPGLIQEAHRQFCLLQEKNPKDVELPIDAGYSSWSEENLCGGVNFWAPGVDSQQVIQDIKQPIKNLPVYICGSAYSNHQGWVEGALETADDMLKMYFGVPSIITEEVEERSSTKSTQPSTAEVVKEHMAKGSIQPSYTEVVKEHMAKGSIQPTLFHVVGSGLSNSTRSRRVKGMQFYYTLSARQDGMPLSSQSDFVTGSSPVWDLDLSGFKDSTKVTLSVFKRPNKPVGSLEFTRADLRRQSGAPIVADLLRGKMPNKGKLTFTVKDKSD